MAAKSFSTAFLPSFSQSATLGDIDGDNNLNTIIINYYDRDTDAYLNDGAGHFTLAADLIPSTELFGHVSLGDLLADAGLVSIAQCPADGSQIKGWQEFLLDTDADGEPSRNNTPRSLYMEARRPKEVPEQQPLPAIAPDRMRRAG